MADERTERADQSNASSAPHGDAHAGPTIDLDASQVTEHPTDKTGAEAEETVTDAAATAEDARPQPAPRGASLLLAGLCGGTAALAVAGALWFGFDRFAPSPPPVTTAQFKGVAANVDALTARLAKAEAASSRPSPSPDAALMKRTEAAEAAFAAMRDELAAVKTQLTAASKSFDESKMRTSATPPDAARIDERLDRIERSMQTLQLETAKREPAAAEDVNARRLAVASALDMAVSRGEPFAGQLAAAKQLAAGAQSLGALDAFAAKGVPGEAIYLRRIVTILERASRPATPARAVAAAPEAGGVLERLQAGLAKLVRIERSDAPAAVPQRALPAVTESDDLAGVRRDVAKLPQAEQPEIQAWLKSVAERDAALAAARAFANDALAKVAKSGQ